MLKEINFDGIVGPSHNYAGLSLGNLASTRNAGEVSRPRAAALQGIDKMRANLALGLDQGLFVPQPRPARRWLAELGTTIEEADPVLAANAMSASAMWAANAATVSPAPDTADGRCHLTVANLRTMPHRSHEWHATLAQLRLAFADERAFRGPRARPARVRRRGRGQSHAAGERARRAGRRDFRLWRRRRRLPGAPASRGVASDRPPPPARPRTHPVRPAVRRGDRRGGVPQRRRRGRQRPGAVRPRTRLRGPRPAGRSNAPRDCRSSNWSRWPRPKCRSPTRSNPICSTPNWSRRPTAR